MNDSTKKAWRIFWMGSAACVAFVVILLLVHQSRSERVLQRYISGLRAKGEKLTYADLKISPPDPSNGSSVALVRATGKLKAPALAPAMLDLRKFVGPGQAHVLWRQPLPNEDTRPANPKSSPAPAQAEVTWTDFREQIESNQAALAEIREALRNPPPSSGIVPNIAAGRSSFNFVSIRMAAQWLAGAMISDLQAGRLEEALQNLEALGGIARLDREDYMLVSQMIRVAVAGLGLAATWELLQAPELTDVQLQRLDAIWRNVDLLDGLERGFVGERALGCQVWSALQTASAAQTRSLLGLGSSKTKSIATLLEDYVGLPAYQMTSINDDQLFYLRVMQENVESARAIRQHSPWVTRKSVFDQHLAEINRIAAGPERFRYWITLAVMPNLGKASGTVARNETERHMTLAAIALRRYRLSVGRFPDKLEDVVPTFLASVPIDCMNGKALSYRLNADGSFTLYSVGEDGCDDGGDPTAAPKANLTFWSGRDAVWPVALSK